MNYWFDASQIDDPKPMGPLPVGRYPAVVTNTEMKQARTKDDGQNYEMLLVEFSIEDTEGKMRHIMHSYNLHHPNEDTRSKSWSYFKVLAVALGKERMTGPQELVGGRCEVDLGHREYNGNVYNSVKNIYKSGGSVSSRPASNAQPSAAPAGFPGSQQTAQRSTMDLSNQAQQGHVNSDGLPF